MIHGVEGIDVGRRDQLIRLLGVDPEWRLNKVSDGQRRRVQISMGLLKPYQVCCLHAPWAAQSCCCMHSSGCHLA